MRFKAKVDVWLKVLAVGFGGCALLFWGIAIQGGRVVDLILGCVLGLAAAMCFSLWLDTAYTLEESGLRVHSLFCAKLFIPYADILDARPSRSILAAPAPSVERVEIAYKRGQRKQLLLISPKDREGFLRELLLRRP